MHKKEHKYHTQIEMTIYKLYRFQLNFANLIWKIPEHFR